MAVERNIPAFIGDGRMPDDPSVRFLHAINNRPAVFLLRACFNLSLSIASPIQGSIKPYSRREQGYEFYPLLILTSPNAFITFAGIPSCPVIG